MKDESDIPEAEINEMTNRCDELIYSISYVSPNYPSNLINIQKENFKDEQDISKEDENLMCNIDLLSEHKIKNIINAKAIKGELWFLVELSNGEITFIPNNIANQYISDDFMIDFLSNQIKKNKNNFIPKLSKSDIANNPHTSFFQLPYILSKSYPSASDTISSLNHEIGTSDKIPKEEEADFDENQVPAEIISPNEENSEQNKVKSKTKIRKSVKSNQKLQNDIQSDNPTTIRMVTRSKDKSTEKQKNDLKDKKNLGKVKQKKSK